MGITVVEVTKKFGDFVALDDVSVAIPEGSLTALLGPSGSGKSTLLRVIAGLEEPDGGQVLLGDDDVTHQPARARGVGMVFQHYAAFKHMTVWENVAFGLKVRKRPKPEIENRVHELLELVQLEGLAKRYPAQLSGGQRQRMALARALAVDPEVLLLDEPFGALDARVRKELRAWLRRLHDEVHVTTIIVTHDQEEAMEVAGQIVVINHGRVEQVGTPRELYDSPANEFVMSFELRRPGQQDRRHLRPAARHQPQPRARRRWDRGDGRAGRPSWVRGQGGARPRRRPAPARAADAGRGAGPRARARHDRLRETQPPDHFHALMWKPGLGVGGYGRDLVGQPSGGKVREGDDLEDGP